MKSKIQHEFSRNGFPCGGLKWRDSNAGFKVCFTFDGKMFAKFKNGQIEEVKGATIAQCEKYGIDWS